MRVGTLVGLKAGKYDLIEAGEVGVVRMKAKQLRTEGTDYEQVIYYDSPSKKFRGKPAIKSVEKKTVKKK